MEIQFSHEGRNYTAYRDIEERKEDKDKKETGKTDFKISIKSTDGRDTGPVGNPEKTMFSVLPEGLNHYFFLAGESLEKLGGEESAEEIKEAIKILMGLEIFSKSIEDLSVRVKKRSKGRFGKHAKSDKTIS